MSAAGAAAAADTDLYFHFSRERNYRTYYFEVPTTQYLSRKTCKAFNLNLFGAVVCALRSIYKKKVLNTYPKVMGKHSQ